ncbi:hypothetical protein [Amphibacillus indicireducens]|uniref:Uncharacterized protein n=1 Tax=Amphibacillus indicireducens TaxID=1076330 RepID=A0ABP7VU50_9BACI
MIDKSLLNRNVSPEVITALNNFLSYKILEKNEVSLEWKFFYEFIIKSYDQEREERYSVSELGFILKKKEIKPSIYINAYAHSLYSLALYNQKDIYGEGFNI